MSPRALRPGMYWLRNDSCVHVIVHDDQPALILTGADADLFERWISGMSPDDAMAEVALCYRLASTEARRRLHALLRRLEEAGAMLNDARSSPTATEGS